MNIITWNANSTTRYPQLWADPLVTAWNWDIICLQEAGNPDPAWVHVGGPVWVPNQAARDTDESSVRRRYTFTPLPMQPAVHILHAEWPNRQKNHLVIITKMPSNNRMDMSGQMGERPAAAIKARLTWPGAGGAVLDVLIGTVHIVSSFKASPEFNQMISFFESARAMTQSAAWIMIGDYNCLPGQLRQTVPNVAVVSPGVWTHNSGNELDYMVTSHAGTLACGASAWNRGTAASDHSLMYYTQVAGPVVQIL